MRIQQKNRKSLPALPKEERRRRKREFVISIVIIVLISLMTLAENRIIHFGGNFPVSNTILMFILININLLLLLLLIFLVFRNLVKLLYDRRRNVMGAKLGTKLVAAFITLTLLPSTILFFFSINFITTSIEFWFNVPVEQALENSLEVGRSIYETAERTHRFFLERIAYQIRAKSLMEPDKRKALERYIQIAQRAFNLDGVEVYAANANRLAVSSIPELGEETLQTVSAVNLQKELSAEGIRSFTATTSDVELLRTISTIPFGAHRDEASGYIVLSFRIPQDLTQKTASISRGFEQYQQIKLLKNPIQITYYITLSIVGLLVVFCAIWFGFYLARSITEPIKELADGTRRVAEGDLSVSIGEGADDEIGTLVESFNRMTRDLRQNREQLELSARMLRQQNIENEKRRQYIEIVLKNVSAGVITLGADGVVTTINTSAETMLHLNAPDILHRRFRDLLDQEQLELADDILRKFETSEEDTVEVSLRLTVAGRQRSFLVHVSALRDDAGRNMGIVMVFDDLTDLERAQRMAAWREVARRIAHEVKNPLTPIILSAQRIQRKYSRRLDESVFDECTQMIIDQVELIRNLVNEFSAFARFPTANPAPCQLPPVIEETLALYREGHPEVHFHVRVDGTIPTVHIDRQQIKQAMINLVDNAIAAMREKGTIWIDVRHDSEEESVRIEVADDGPGISAEDKTRLFEPYFSTKKSGMGLGLTIVNTIVEDHNGTISVADRDPSGAIFAIQLPV
ncbi:MAG: HAMP domain-containing protein [Desulfobacteraceae bacterium]|nr:HAMP domain-containing protein [Desulfobacteraceae bacterium]